MTIFFFQTNIHHSRLFVMAWILIGAWLQCRVCVVLLLLLHRHVAGLLWDVVVFNTCSKDARLVTSSTASCIGMPKVSSMLCSHLRTDPGSVSSFSIGVQRQVDALDQLLSTSLIRYPRSPHPKLYLNKMIRFDHPPFRYPLDSREHRPFSASPLWTLLPYRN